MRVLHLSEAVRGGVGVYLSHLIEQQRRDRRIERVRLLVPARHRAELDIPDDLVHTVPSGPGRLASAWRLATAAHRLLARERPDILHLHSSFAGLAGRVLPRPAGVRLVYCAHGWAFLRDSGKTTAALVCAAERALAWRSDAIIAISEDERRAALRARLPAPRLHRVHNGLPDIDPPPPADWRCSKHQMRVLFVGRFDRQKGFDVFTDVARRLGPRADCVAIGDFSADAARPLALPPNLRRTGWLPNREVAAWLAAADVLVMPSRWEGFGLTAIEAMRAGVAVIASRVGGLPEIVDDGVTGWLVPAAEAAPIVARLAVTDRAQLAALGCAGRRRFLALFTAERMHHGTLAVYRHCLGSELPLRTDVPSTRDDHHCPAASARSFSQRFP